jgi:hypothetical protein
LKNLNNLKKLGGNSMVTTVKKIEIDTKLLNKISKMAKEENTTENKPNIKKRI